MKNHHIIFIAGAGGIAEAVGLILAEWSEITPTIFIGNRTLSKALKVAKWIEDGTTKPCTVKGFKLPEVGITEELKNVLTQSDIILDCLPISLAPKMAHLAKDFQLHYVNLTEYVTETNKIITLAKDASTGFALQTGLAPGYINVLANHLFQKFCINFNIDTVNKLEFKVGALTKHAVAPHYYGFTWSPVGVATEYCKDAMTLRNYKKVILPALSERATIIIDGVKYEEDLTSRGAADLPDALNGKVTTLDYKTLRYPGHYHWIQKQLSKVKKSKNTINLLQQKMEVNIPYIEDDQVVFYAAIEENDNLGILRRKEISNCIKPQKVGKHTLKAIQATTAAPMAQVAQLVLEKPIKGVLLQSEIDTISFLNGKYIVPVYGVV